MTYPIQILKVDSADRIANKLPVPVENATTLDANRVMYLLDKILSGQYRAMPKQWTTATRPTLSDTPPVQLGESGFNSDNNSSELFTGATYGWLILNGIWTTLDDAPTADIAPGSRGFVIGVGSVQFDGISWNLG
jgi:hypothetical protein